MIDKSRLKQMIKLCQLREKRATTALQKQQANVLLAKSVQEEKANLVAKLEAEKKALSRSHKEIEVRDIRDNHLVRRWLKYDDEKAQYFLHKAEDELAQQSEEARLLSADLHRTRKKQTHYSNLLKGGLLKTARRKESSSC